MGLIILAHIALDALRKRLRSDRGSGGMMAISLTVTMLTLWWIWHTFGDTILAMARVGALR